MMHGQEQCLFFLQLAFEGLKPFPKRRDIQTKQTCYLNTLKEKHKKKELQRLAFAEREQLVSKWLFFVVSSDNLCKEKQVN